MWCKVTDINKNENKTFLARNEFEKENFNIVLNPEYNTWALAVAPYILVTVREVWID